MVSSLVLATRAEIPVAALVLPATKFDLQQATLAVSPDQGHMVCWVVYRCVTVPGGAGGGISLSFRGLLLYEAPSFLFTSIFGGSLSLLGEGTPRKLMQLRHKPRLAALMACQIPCWFLCPDVLPVTVTATLCLLLLASDKPEYLADDSLKGTQHQQFSFCQICESFVLPALKDKTTLGLPRAFSKQ